MRTISFAASAVLAACATPVGTDATGRGGCDFGAWLDGYVRASDRTVSEAAKAEALAAFAGFDAFLQSVPEGSRDLVPTDAEIAAACAGLDAETFFAISSAQYRLIAAYERAASGP